MADKTASIELPFLGEQLIIRMLECEPCREFLRKKGIKIDRDFVQALTTPFAFRGVALDKVNGHSFDGASKVDILLRTKEGVGHAIEVKLGKTRLSKTRVVEEWLRVGCRQSDHTNKRLAGNMMAILDRRFPWEEDIELRSQEPNVLIEKPWSIIAHESVLKSWDSSMFQQTVNFLPFNELVKSFGDKAAFNRMCKEELNFDYYDTWLKPDE